MDDAFSDVRPPPVKDVATDLQGLKMELRAMKLEQEQMEVQIKRYMKLPRASPRGSTSFVEAWDQQEDKKTVGTESWFTVFAPHIVTKTNTNKDVVAENITLLHPHKGTKAPGAKKPEKDVQEYFNSAIKKALGNASAATTLLEGTESGKGLPKQFLGGRKLDIALKVKGKPHSPLWIASIGELKAGAAAYFDSTAHGQLMTFLLRVLHAQRVSGRNKVSGFLSNGHSVVFMGVNEGEVMYTEALPLESGINAALLTAYIVSTPEQLMFCSPRLRDFDLQVVDFLAAGASAKVFAVEHEKGYAVVKQFEDEKFDKVDCAREMYMLDRCAKLDIPAPRIVDRRPAKEPTSLLLTPMLTPYQFYPPALDEVLPVQAEWKCLLKTLQVLHGAGFVHCDVRPENWLQDDASAMLIDWCFARRYQSASSNQSQDEEEDIPGRPGMYHGTTSFASVRVLETLADRIAKSDDTVVVVEPEDDLESFVRMVHCFVTRTRPSSCNSDHKTKVDSSLEFWQHVLHKSKFWRLQREAAQSRNYEQLDVLCGVFVSHDS